MGKAKNWKWVELKPGDVLEHEDVLSDRKGGVMQGSINKVGKDLYYWPCNRPYEICPFRLHRIMKAHEKMIFFGYEFKFYRKVPVVVKQEVTLGNSSSVTGINKEKKVQQESREGFGSES